MDSSESPNTNKEKFTPSRLNRERDVCDRLCIGRSTYRELIRSGQLRPVRIGHAVRISDAEIERFVAEREKRGE